MAGCCYLYTYRKSYEREHSLRGMILKFLNEHKLWAQFKNLNKPQITRCTSKSCAFLFIIFSTKFGLTHFATHCVWKTSSYTCLSIAYSCHTFNLVCIAFIMFLLNLQGTRMASVVIFIALVIHSVTHLYQSSLTNWKLHILLSLL